MGNVMDLNITHEKLNGTHYLELVGEVQSYTAPKLKAILFPLSEETKQKSLLMLRKLIL